MQQSLLRVLQEKEITPIGKDPMRVDVRFIAATNKDLVKLCEEGRFRWDLYYRLCVVELELPTLAERGPDDLQQMIDFFMKKKAELMKKAELTLSSSAREILMAYNYPGNIRELENIIEGLYVFCDKTVLPSDLPRRLTSFSPQPVLPLQMAEKDQIEEMLRRTAGNQAKAAKNLGMAINTLKNKLRKYGLTLADYKTKTV
jgi:DNA-binding NtrC family response regulator